MRSAESVTRASSVSIAPGSARLFHLTAQYPPRSMCGIGVTTHPTRMHLAAFCANEYLDYYIKDRIVWFNPFEP
jgi:hypothetical protein